VLGCGQATSPTRSGLATIEGSLTLQGTVRNATGALTGSRVVSAPGGIRVYLHRSGTVVDSTLTVAGKYTFSLGNGTYRIGLRAGPLVMATSSDIVIDGNTFFLGIPAYEMTSSPGIVAFPNPFTTEQNERFGLAADGAEDLQVFSLANLRLRTLLAASMQAAGSHDILWNGQDGLGSPVADGAYWVVFSGGGGTAAELVFKGP
jgi:hypothetical protein